jgi:glycosyltransferase involved in cell wall biosynthesis
VSEPKVSTDSSVLISSEVNEQLPNPVRVAMVAACPFPANHGTPGAIRELSLHLARQGHEIHVVTYPQSEDIPIDGLHIHRVRIPFMKPGPISIGPSLERIFYDILLIPKLVQVIRRHRIDVIHAHNYEATMAGAVAKWLTRRPLIYNGVTAMADELPSYRFIRPDALARWFGKLLDNLVPRSSDLLMVLSDELKDYLVAIGNAENKVLVVPPGVELEWLATGKADKVRAKLGLNGATPVVMYTGALESFQRVDYLLQAMALAVKQVPESVLVIVGNIKNQKAQDHYLSMAAELGIAEQLHFVPSAPIEELPDYLAMADVTVVPRPSCPGYPIKLLNYMAASKAVVSFAGSAKSLCHGYSGYVAKNDDVEDLANGIVMFLQNPDVARIMGERARASLEGVFDWPTLAAGVAETYRQLMKDRKKFRREALAKYFKHSYTPILEEAQQRSPLLKDGKLTYPKLMREDP